MLDCQTPNLGIQTLSHAARMPSKRAIVCDGIALSYSELTAKAKRCAARLQAEGLISGGGGRLGVLASPGLDFAVLVLASHLAGVTVVPLPGLVSADALARMIEDAEISILFHDRDYSDRANTAVAQLRDPSRLARILIGNASGSGSLDEWLETSDVQMRSVSFSADWTSDLIYSSGTTGEPKGIAQSYRARVQQCIDLARIGMAEDTKILLTTGLYSNFGIGALLAALWWGSTFFCLRKFSAEGVIDLLETQGIDMAWCPPAALIRILGAEGFRELVDGRTCIKFSGGAPISEALKLQTLKEWPGPFFDIYGQTETGVLTLLPIHEVPADKLQSVGMLLPDVVVKIMDEDGNELPQNAEGEIVASSSTMMKGYHRRDEANVATYWFDRRGRAFIKTGDIGRLDEDGYLWLCDRKKDLIISGGQNIYAADIEGVLQAHPAVFEMAVVGCPSHGWGESPVAFVSLKKDAQVEEFELRDWLNERVEVFQRVARVIILPQLPNGSMGKILKRDLRNLCSDLIGTLP